MLYGALSVSDGAQAPESAPPMCVLYQFESPLAAQWVWTNHPRRVAVFPMRLEITNRSGSQVRLELAQGEFLRFDGATYLTDEAYSLEFAPFERRSLALHVRRLGRKLLQKAMRAQPMRAQSFSALRASRPLRAQAALSR